MLRSFWTHGWKGIRTTLYFKAKILKSESLDNALREVATDILDQYGLHVGEDIFTHKNKKEEIQHSFDGTLTSFTATFDEFYVTVTDQDDNVFDITFDPAYFRKSHDCEH